MILATIFASPLFLEASHLSDGSSDGAGIPPWVIPVVIFIILVLIFASSYFSSTGIQGKGAEATAVTYGDHADEPTTRAATLPTELMEAPETAVIVPEEKETAVVVVPEPEPEPEPAQPDNLKIVEGIGPKIEGILHDAGILTYAQLAAATIAHLEKVVREDAGIRVAFPATWPEQAKLAADGLWDALEKLQDDLKGGRRA